MIVPEYDIPPEIVTVPEAFEPDPPVIVTFSYVPGIYPVPELLIDPEKLETVKNAVAPVPLPPSSWILLWIPLV